MEHVYVLGGSQTDFERNWTKEGKNILALLREVVADGLTNTNIDYNEIDKLKKKNRIAVFVGNFNSEQYISQGHLGAMVTEIDKSFYGVSGARYEAACASGSAALDAAIAKLNSCEIDMAIVIGVEIMKSVSSEIGGEYLGAAAYYEQEAKGILYPFPNLFSRLADELISKYSLDETRFLDNLAEISRINYENAKKNQLAQTRNWFMDGLHAQTRNTSTNSIVGGKLAISDCSQVTDGACMVVISNKQYAENNCKKNAKDINEIPIVKGYGHRVAPFTFTNKIKESKQNPYILPWTKQTIDDAYIRAKMSVNDIDFFEVHDCFTSSEYAIISCLGLSLPGEEYKVIEEGYIDFTGKSPINPSGGLIGVGHPVGATGVRMFLDLYKQVSGSAGDYQLEKASNGMMLNIGGTATTNYAFIIGKQ